MNLQDDTFFYDFGLTLSNPMRVDLNEYPSGSIPHFAPDAHYAVHLGIIIQGEIIVYQPGLKFRRSVGEVWFTAPWEPHVSRRTGVKCEIILFTVLLESLGNVSPFRETNWSSPFITSPKDRPQCLTKEAKKKIIDLCVDVKTIFSIPARDDRNCLLWMKLHEMILTVIRNDQTFIVDNKYGPTSLQRIIPAIKLARNNSTSVSVNDAAKACFLGKSRFCELFKSTMGVSFNQFALSARVSGAARDLLNSLLPVENVAEKWGFYDVSHFNKAFRKHFNCSATNFRETKQSEPLL